MPSSCDGVVWSGVMKGCELLFICAVLGVPVAVMEQDKL